MLRGNDNVLNQEPSDSRLEVDVIQWDVLNWRKVLIFWQRVIGRLPDKQNMRVLCLGERDGGLALWFSLQGFQVVCSDIHEVTGKARTLHQTYHVDKRLTYDTIDIFHIQYPNDSFDIVACKSVIGGLKSFYKDSSTRTLANQKIAIDEVRRVLKPGGYFLGAENLRGSYVHQYLRRRSKGNKIGWRHLTRNEIEWLFSNFSSLQQLSYGFVGTFYQYTVVNKITGLLDQILSGILKQEWLYIGFIAARK